MTLPGWVGVREPRGRLGGLYAKNVTICPTQGCTKPQERVEKTQGLIIFNRCHKALNYIATVEYIATDCQTPDKLVSGAGSLRFSQAQVCDHQPRPGYASARIKLVKVV